MFNGPYYSMYIFVVTFQAFKAYIKEMTEGKHPGTFWTGNRSHVGFTKHIRRFQGCKTQGIETMVIQIFLQMV